MPKYISPVTVPFKKRKVIGLSLSSAIALLSGAQSYAAQCDSVSVTTVYIGSANCVDWTADDLTLSSSSDFTSTSTPALTASGTARILTNDGLLSGTSAAALVNTSSSLVVLNNSRILSDTVGISNNSTNLSLSNNIGGTISGSQRGIDNTGSITSISNSGAISGGYGIFNDGNITSLTNNIGGTISGSQRGIENTGSITALSNSGAISGGYGILNDGNIATLTNNIDGTISGTSAGIENTGNITTFNNAGAISGAFGISNDANISALTNTGSITGTTAGIINASTITALKNNHVISGGLGIINNGNISTFINTASITGSINGIYNRGSVSGLLNSGVIQGSNYGVQTDNDSTLSYLNNASTGMILGGTGILVGNSGSISSGAASINTLVNDGLISGTNNIGVSTSANGTISSLVNNGVINGFFGAVNNTGKIGTLVNNGALYSSSYAIYNAPTGILGPVTNSGLIAGNIFNTAGTGLTINGGTGSIVGVLTGASGSIDSASMGTITHGASDLTFASGNLLLNDTVNVGSYTANNSGATLQVNNLVSIKGNYAQGSLATLLIGVGDSAVANGVTADTGYGRLIVRDSASIASGSNIALKSLNTYKFAAGQRYVVITAAENGTSYNADTLNYSALGYTGTATGSVVNSDDTSNLVVSLGSKPVNTPATTGNAISSLNGLKQYSGIAPGLLDLYNASLAISSTSEANKVGEQLSPVQNSSASQAASVATFDAVGIVGQRVDSVRLAQTRGMSGVATGDDPAEWSAWGQVFGGHANQGMIDNVSGYKANYSGLVLGGDRNLSEAWLAGGALTYSHTSVRGQDNLSGNKTGVDSYGLIGYASYTGEPWFVNLSASVTQQRYDSTRNVAMTGYSDRAQGKYDGQQYVTKAEFGYPLAVADSTTLTPLANLSYSYLTLDGYKESSDNGSALNVDGSHTNALRSGLGARLDKSFQTGFGDVVPYVQAIWTHQYNAKRSASTASYVADTTGETSFTTFGASPAEDTADLSVGATVLQSDTLSLNARYNLQLGEQYQGQTVSFQVRKTF